MKTIDVFKRRDFIKSAGILSAGMLAFPLANSQKKLAPVDDDNIYLIGPQKGYDNHVGALLSTMTMMRTWLIQSVELLSVEQLDFQIDDQSNSIGAMLYHLAATEKYYQLNTFDNMTWGTWDKAVKKEWDVPMNLGEEGRKQIKGNDAKFYISKLNEVREITKREFANRDDKWLMASEPFFENKPTNNYCKWFHVCEHESNHRGQIKFILKRIEA